MLKEISDYLKTHPKLNSMNLSHDCINEIKEKIIKNNPKAIVRTQDIQACVAYINEEPNEKWNWR